MSERNLKEGRNLKKQRTKTKKAMIHPPCHFIVCYEFGKGNIYIETCIVDEKNKNAQDASKKK